MIPVHVANVSLTKVGFVVLLKGDEDPRTLPIFIGIPEAQAIAVQLRGIQPPRPLPHDLLKNLMERLGADLVRVEIHNFDDGVFYAHLILHTDSGEVKQDARPSDAIALALRCHAPVLVAQSVMDEAGVDMEQQQAEGDTASIRNVDAPPMAPPSPPNETEIRPADPLSRLQAELEKAVREERYEDAARIRDEIRRFSESSPPNHN